MYLGLVLFLGMFVGCATEGSVDYSVKSDNSAIKVVETKTINPGMGLRELQLHIIEVNGKKFLVNNRGGIEECE